MHMHAPQPELTEVEALKLENLRLEGRYIDSQRIHLDRAVQDWHAKLAALKTALEQTREGWDFNPRTAQWTRRGEEAPATGGTEPTLKN